MTERLVALRRARRRYTACTTPTRCFSISASNWRRLFSLVQVHSRWPFGAIMERVLFLGSAAV